MKPNTFVASIVLSGRSDCSSEASQLPPSSSRMPVSSDSKDRVFHGYWMETIQTAIDSVYSSAIEHFKKCDGLVIHDDSFKDLVRTRRELKASQFWADMLQHSCESLRSSLNEQVASGAQLKADLVSLCRAHGNIMYIKVSSADTSTAAVEYTGSNEPTSDLEKLSSELAAIIEKMNVNA